MSEYRLTREQFQTMFDAFFECGTPRSGDNPFYTKYSAADLITFDQVTGSGTTQVMVPRHWLACLMWMVANRESFAPEPERQDSEIGLG